MIIERENLALVECRFLAAVSERRRVRLGDILERFLQIRERELISRPE